MIANIAPLPAGRSITGFDKLFSAEIVDKDLSLMFDPRTNTVTIEFSYELTKYKQHWSFENRQLFIQAVDSYISDFETRTLSAQCSKTEKTYGSFKGKAEWGTMFYNSLSYPQMTLGYTFNNKSPYFVVVQKPAPNERADELNMPQNDSNTIRFFFTRLQAQELASLFIQEYLLGLIPETVQKTMGTAPDEY
jgi:hypothetical protein